MESVKWASSSALFSSATSRIPRGSGTSSASWGWGRSRGQIILCCSRRYSKAAFCKSNYCRSNQHKALKTTSDLVPRDGSWPVPPLCVNGNKHPKSCVHVARDLPDFRSLPQRPLSPAVTFYKQSVSHISSTHIATSLTLSLTGAKFWCERCHCVGTGRKYNYFFSKRFMRSWAGRRYFVKTY